MSTVSIDKFVDWRAGAGTPVKYAFEFHGTIEMTSMTSAVANFSLSGTASVTNHPNNSRNSWAASDFAALCPGDKDIWNYQFSSGTSYYQSALPCAPNAPAGYAGAILTEFRGDTWASSGPNKASLYTKSGGLILNQLQTEETRSFAINETFSITLNGQSNQPILVWASSGADNSTTYSWYAHDVWLSIVDFDYVPGKIWNGSDWLSHNRTGGDLKIYDGTSWNGPLKTYGGGVVSGNPPTIHNGSSWFNQRLIGTE